MKTPGALLFRMVLYIFLLCMGTLTIRWLIHSFVISIPPVASYLMCTDGATIQDDWAHDSWDQPGQKTLAGVFCMDKNGRRLAPLSARVTEHREFILFTPVGLIIMFFLVGPLAVRDLRMAGRDRTRPGLILEN